MSIASTSVRRPVLTIVLSAFIVLFGLIGLNQVGVREYPAIDPPIINVRTTYTGANAEIIANQITEPLESAINSIDGIRAITSVSREEQSNITVEFNLGADMEQAANDVRDKVSQAQRRLPEDADASVVSKADANASPILVLSLGSDNMSPLELTDLSERIQERLQTVSGVAEMRIWGIKRYAMRIYIDPVRLAGYGLTLEIVRSALERENAEFPAGQLEGTAAMVSLRSSSKLVSEEDFRNVILFNSGDKFVRLGDVAEVVLGAENERNTLRMNGRPMVSLVVVAQPGADQIKIADEVLKRAKEIEKDLPEGVTIETTFDNTRFVREALSEVKETMFIAFILVIGVIFLFLREFRTTFIPMITVPISLIGSFFIIWILGFSINVLTLLGVVLAIAIVVDDAIVVLENIFAKIEQGLPPKEAANKGVNEIFAPVVSTTLVLCAVFTPLLFMEGFTGRLFREFAVIIGGSVIISSFVALTLGTMLSSRVLKKQETRNRFYTATEPFFKALSDGYSKFLRKALRYPMLAIPVILLCSGISVFVFLQLPTELAPLEDRSRVVVQITAHEGAPFSYMNEKMKVVEHLVRESVPEIDRILVQTSPIWAGSPNLGNVQITLVPPTERKRTQQQIANDLRRVLSQVEGVRLSIQQDQTIRVGTRGGLPVQVVVQANELDSLKKYLPALMDKIQTSRLLTMADVNLKFTKPQMSVEMDRDFLRASGIAPREAAQALQLAYSGLRYGYFLKEGKQYQIIGEIDARNKNEPASLQALYLRNSSGDLVSLDQIVDLKEEAVPPQIFRYNRYVSATISANPAEGVALGDAITEMHGIIKGELNESFRTELAGTSRDFMEASGSLVMVFILALIIVYMLLAAQFESFRHPFTIMLTVPLALFGALLSLYFGGHTINIFSQIGLVMLVGLVTKNGILIVEFANQRHAAGLTLRRAVADAAGARLRPILMTTLSTVFGFMPIALALGAGAESRVPMGVAIIGGIMVSLVFSLLVIPASYLLISKKTR
ncbi:MAG: efflux RND transporter permease subunit [Fibromonadales bacterium]|nr:efflux RND transporter permease subunit [Fibromonadales bacterium]